MEMHHIPVAIVGGGPLVAAARARNLPLDVLDVPSPEVRDLYARDLALIRPDQYVAWRGNALPQDADRLLGRAVGAV
jgi:hypothetical protein